MNSEERKKVFKSVIKEANGRVPVVVGCNETNTRAVIELAKSAQDNGADGVMITPPYYLAPSDEQILDFYERIAQNIDIGIMIYNNPEISGRDIPLKVLHKLAVMEKVVGLKDCTQDCDKFQLTAMEIKNKLTLLNGNNELWEPLGTLAGTKGFISISANFAPILALNLWEACKNKNFLEAKELSRKLTSFVRFQLETNKPIQAAKWILKDLGLGSGFIRSPLLALNDEEKLRIEVIRKKINI